MSTKRTKLIFAVALAILSSVFVIGGAQQNVQGQNRNYPYGQDRDYGRRRSWDSYPNWGGSFDLRQTALNAGYNEGMKAGTNDRQRNRSANYSDQNEYRKATKDYSSRLGDRELYRRYFREAYQTGYNDGYGIYNNNGGYINNGGYNNDGSYNNGGYNNDGRYNNNRDRNGNWNRDDWNRNRRGRNWDQYDNYGGNFQLRQTALNAGYNEGIKEGRNDARRGRRNDFRNSGAYRDATKDYSSRLGDKELYRRYYRAGYENGYYDGLSGN
jgi:hypothetical protein